MTWSSANTTLIIPAPPMYSIWGGGIPEVDIFNVYLQYAEEALDIGEAPLFPPFNNLHQSGYIFLFPPVYADYKGIHLIPCSISSLLLPCEAPLR